MRWMFSVGILVPLSGGSESGSDYGDGENGGTWT